MRKVIIGLAILFVLLIAILILAIWNVNTYLEHNRETFAGMASDAAGREVSFEGAKVAFASGLAIRVTGLRVAEDPRFGQVDFLSLDEAYVGVRILPALQQRIEVSGIRLDAPMIRVIQTADGFNFSTLGGGAEESSGETAVEEPGPPAEEGAPLALAIAVLEIVDGSIFYEDRTSPDGLFLVIDEFKTSGTDLALDGPISIDFSGLARSAKEADAGIESRLEGEVRLESLNLMAGTVRLKSPSFHPAIFGVRLEEGDVVERIDSLEIEAVLTADPAKSGYPVQIRSEEARLAGFDLDSIDIDVVYRDSPRGSEIQIDQVLIELAGGSVDLSGDAVLGEPSRSPFDLRTEIRELDSGELAAALLGLPAGMLSGKLGGNIALQGDSLEWESLKRSLRGSLDLQIGEGALEQANLLNSLVGRLLADPGFGQLVAGSIRDVAPDALEGDRTPFEAIDMALEIADGAIRAKDVSMKTNDFALQTEGRVGLDGAISADGTIRFSEDLSRKILAKADRLRPILSDGDTVELPLRVGGTTDAPSLVPDLAALSEKATAGAKEELTNRAAKELGDALFGKKREGDPEDPARDADRDETESRIKEGLGRFLGR
jgi:uncharacterized protein involved in outer membrane biogenesis